MSTYNNISLNQLDLDALADYVVLKKRLVYRDNANDNTVTSSNIAQDVEKVGGKLANTIALAVTQDRKTVENSQKLEDHPASYFMSNTEGLSLQSKYLLTKQHHGDELQNILDEFYTLRQELAKSGIIEDRGEYSGYIDTFRKKSPKHLFEQLAVADAGNNSSQIYITESAIVDSLKVYDYLVLVNEEYDQFCVRQISDINSESNIITFSQPIDDDVYAATDGIALYLSRGINDSGMFKFAKEGELILGSEEYHSGLSDDTHKLPRHVEEPYKGFGYSFRVPSEKQGYVKSFEICAKAHGNPGAMICYLIDERDINHFFSPAQALADYQTSIENQDESYHFFAASRPYILPEEYGTRYIKFDFLQDNNQYPLMPQDQNEEPVRYIAIIECLECDHDNYYDIRFLQHRNSGGELTDLELNNTTYYYTRKDDGSDVPALSSDNIIDSSDMYYHIVTVTPEEKSKKKKKEGLYSFHVSTKDMVHKARIMLRIRKEGAYRTNTNDTKPTVYNSSSTIPVINSDPENGIRNTENLNIRRDIYKPLEIRGNSSEESELVTTIIGSNITKTSGIGATTIGVYDPILIKDDDPVYRMAYRVSLKARKTILGSDRVEYTEYKHFYLPLVEVFKDFKKYDKESSDRLIFETNLFTDETDAEDFNDFIVQIYWSNKDISEYADIKNSQMGAIKDISTSFNAGY